MSRSAGRPNRDRRLPRWTWGAIVTGGILAYVGIGILLLGPRFKDDIEDLWRSPGTFTSGGVETVAPFVLLLIPAFLGAIWTRDTFAWSFEAWRGETHQGRSRRTWRSSPSPSWFSSWSDS